MTAAHITDTGPHHQEMDRFQAPKDCSRFRCPLTAEGGQHEGLGLVSKKGPLTKAYIPAPDDALETVNYQSLNLARSLVVLGLGTGRPCIGGARKLGHVGSEAGTSTLPGFRLGDR